MFDMQAGSVHVRVRRDADEQMVLAHVYNRLANIMSVLTVQIFKDDWSRPSAFQILGDPNLLSKTGESRPNLPSSTVSALPTSSTLPYLTGTQPGGSASLRASGPLVSERPEARQFIGGQSEARSVLTSHVSIRFPPIPHYTEVSGPDPTAKSAKYLEGHFDGNLHPVSAIPTVKVQTDKHK